MRWFMPLLALGILLGCEQILDMPPRAAVPNLGCDSGQCECEATWRDCNEELAIDGCEVDVDLDAEHCGQCGHSCRGGTCVAGQCQPKRLGDPLSTTVLTLAVAPEGAFVGASDGIHFVPFNEDPPELLVSLAQSPRAVLVHEEAPVWLGRDGIATLDGPVVPSVGTDRVSCMALRGPRLTYAIGSLATGYRVEQLDLTAPETPADVLATATARPTILLANDDQVYWFEEVDSGGTRVVGSTAPQVALDEWLTPVVPPTALSLEVSIDELLYTRGAVGGFQLSRLALGTMALDVDARVDVAYSFTVRDETIFYSDNNGLIVSLPLERSSAESPRVRASGQDAATLLQATDERLVWLSTEPGGGVLRAQVTFVAR